MEESTPNGSPPHPLLLEELIPNQENHLDENDHDHIGNSMSETDGSSLTSQPSNQSSLNKIGSDENTNNGGPLHPLLAQLQNLRIDSASREGLLHRNSTNQQTLVQDSRIGPSDVYGGELYGNNIINHQTLAAGNSVTGPSHVDEGAFYGNNTINRQTLAAGNSVIGPNQRYEGALYGHNNINQQTLAAGNCVSGPSRVDEGLLYGHNTINQQTRAAGNSVIGPNHRYEGAPYGGNNTINHQTRAVIGNSRTGLSYAYNSSRGRRYIPPLEVVRDRVVSMSKDEEGSRFIKEMLDERNPRDIEYILREVRDHLHDLMMDPIGKCVIEKIFDVVNESQMTLLIKLTTMVNISKFQMDILDAMASKCPLIAAHKIGCYVLQTCMSNATIESAYSLIRAIKDWVWVLAPHQYGNYVVQFVIKLGWPEINQAMVIGLGGGYVELSMDKYASNVVQHLLRFSDQNGVGIIVREIINSPRFLYLLQHCYGNYVAQTALECSENGLYDMLASSILNHRGNLCTDQFGQRVLTFTYGGGKSQSRFRRH
ncbi:hypothetical protein K1719_000965 [Acacia pycnantha]|nr:hypothetical protein K1719_000965 [Acacia pycnantha]